MSNYFSIYSYCDNFVNSVPCFYLYFSTVPQLPAFPQLVIASPVWHAGNNLPSTSSFQLSQSSVRSSVVVSLSSSLMLACLVSCMLFSISIHLLLQLCKFLWITFTKWAFTMILPNAWVWIHMISSGEFFWYGQCNGKLHYLEQIHLTCWFVWMFHWINWNHTEAFHCYCLCLCCGTFFPAGADQDLSCKQKHWIEWIVMLKSNT